MLCEVKSFIKDLTDGCLEFIFSEKKNLPFYESLLDKPISHCEQDLFNVSKELEALSYKEVTCLQVGNNPFY